MSVFFPDILDGFLTQSFLERVKKKYHYEESQMEELKAVAEEMLPLISREAFWERKEWHGSSVLVNTLQGGPENAAALDKPKPWEAVVISLGWGVDNLQEGYNQKGMLSQCYMLDVLASELLLDSYGAYNRYVQEHTKWHVARYHFPGSEEEFPLEMLPDILGALVPQWNRETALQCHKETAPHFLPGIVTCNSAFCMQPKKSVVFMAELTKEGTVRCPGICSGCNSIHCPNRMKETHYFAFPIY